MSLSDVLCDMSPEEALGLGFCLMPDGLLRGFLQGFETQRCLEIVQDSDYDQPDPEDVAEILPEDKKGDWQHVVQLTAYMAVYDRLEQKLASDLDDLRSSLEQAKSEGYTPLGLHAYCVYGLLPHAWEREAFGGILLFWPRLEGGDDKYLLHVQLSEGAAWVELQRKAPGHEKRHDL